MTKAITALTPELSALITSAVAQAVAAALAGQTPAAPAAAAAPAAPSTWDERKLDKVVAWLDANGMPRNRYGMTIKRAEALDLQGLMFRYEQGDRSMLREAPGKQPAAEPSPDDVVMLAAAARAYARKHPERFAKPATPGIRDTLLADGAGWLHCPECEAYWSASRDDAWLERKYRAHLKSPRHAGEPAHAR